jgi:hypothetical protein
MTPLKIEGWVTGFRKVEFTKMLKRELGYSLTTAKHTTDEILTGRRIEIPVGESDYHRVSKLSNELGAVVVAIGVEE